MEKVTQNHYGSGDNVRHKEVHYHEAPHTIPKLLTQKSGLASDNFVGREKELAKITELLNQNSALLLLNGIGGIGKSTLASYYFNKERDKFDYCGFIEVGEDIKSSFFSAFLTSLDLKPEKIDDSFNEVMNKLHDLEGDKLLVLDDMKNIATQKNEINTILTLKNSGFKILFTSREIEENIPQYYLDTMSKEDARKLFLQCYPTDEIEKVDRILEYLDYHTFFVEMTAKTLEKRKRTLSLNSMIEKFESGEFSNIIKDKEESFSKLLSDLFSNDKILKDEENLLFLKRLSVLPSIEISFDDLHTFLVCEDKEKLEILLNELVDNGWLIESNGMYKFHQILKEFILGNYTLRFEEIEDIVDFFIDLVASFTTINSVINNKNSVIFLESVRKFLKNTLNIYDDTLAILAHGEGYIYDILGNVNKAGILYEEALKIREEVLPKNHIHFAISYGGIASIYEKQQDIENACKFYLKSFNIREQYPELKATLAIGYNNVGRMYQELGELDSAEEFLTKSLNIRKEINGDEHESTARAYNVLGKFYLHKYSKTNIEKLNLQAFELLDKSLKIRKKVLYANHPDIAKGYNSLAVFHITFKELKQAKELLNFVINNYTDKEHLENLAEVYCNLGTIFFLEKNEKETIENIDKAIKIWRTMFPENHPYIKHCKEILTRLDNHI